MVLNQIIFSKKTQSKGFEDDKISDKPSRSVTKALSWRLIVILDTLVVSYAVKGEIGLATLIASVDFLTKLTLYFFHERIWNKINCGE